MSNMFNNPNNPFNFELMQRMAQYNQLTQQNYYINQQDIYQELQTKLQGLSTDEKNMLFNDSLFVKYNTMYEQGLLQFIASQYRQQYNSSPEGLEVLKALSGTVTSKLEHIKAELDNEREQMRKISELIKKNPEILNQLNNGGGDNKEA